MNPLRNILARHAKPKQSYNVDGQTIRRIFMRDPVLFRNMPELHYPILAMLGMPSAAVGKRQQELPYDIAKAYFTEPNRRLDTPDFVFSESKNVHASSGIMYTEFPLSGNRSGFAVMLRDRMLCGEDHKAARHDCVKLALGGAFQPDGQFTVTKIMLPANYINSKSKKSGLKETPVHEDSVRGALYYARLCTDQLFNRQQFTPDYNFDRSVMDLQDHSRINVITRDLKQ